MGLDDLPDKMDQLLEMAKRKSIDLQKSDRTTETKLDEETLNKMMNEFQQSMQEILRKDVVENLMAQKNDRKEFENSLDETMNKLMENMNIGGKIKYVPRY